jgi:N-acetylmuramoyl-L-alanine amidase
MITLSEMASPNFDGRDGPIDLVILHYTGMQTGAIALQRLRDPDPRAGIYAFPWENPPDPAGRLGRVSAHYVVTEAGEILRLVDEESRAWHAGAGSWEGEAALNSRSIGIEIVNGGHDFGLPDFPDVQIEAVVRLVADILRRRGLGKERVVAHSDVAPTRKADPGEKFPWKRLATADVALWPANADDDVLEVGPALAAFGYDIGDETAAIKAFQRRFRPNRVDGAADRETRGLLANLLAQLACAQVSRTRV